MSDPDIKLVVVPRELYYHEVAYVRGLETVLNEAYTVLEADITQAGGRWHGNEQKMRLLERIENLLHK